ncbi:dTDP-4-dehydrorhamnose 3,5-epimerase [Candidatus Epulonipiscium fishelsonii]|uniref:dTDP-4-dehydrorhamnose 3,5-epimerase n=1 Tax=Candidatus Epulonipiscium fishelsonii TaxID=77094 RepID=A0ACC8XD54_9FIRM|nr:dTDP-4-dehydrorhamnose 3,5-epimerase [Epulopiscium sp. SCG-B05WGA-EpuloA1]ONI40800.1 dTDP-4-dehydrorhamnose 3,5-epimerase [Epulopiscium sp. SCG-B11WGA-EpuloA1]
MGQIKIIQTKIKDLVIIEPKVFGDERGYFFESYSEQDFNNLGLNMKFVQDNESRSSKGVLRGMHFQKKHAQGKLVRVVEGEVFDVAIDLRENSVTFGQWEGVFLSSQNKKQFYVPCGFAHGFLVISDFATFQYKCTDYYSPEYEAGILWNDKKVDIQWPLDKVEKITLSPKDENQQTFEEFMLKSNPFKL